MIRNFEMLTESGNEISHTKDCSNPIVSTFSVLFLARGPSAVFWRIVSIIVDSVYRLSVRFLTHICKESIKFFPSFADLDSSATVVWKGVLVWVSATFSHLAPKDVGLGLFGCLPMFESSLASAFNPVASARSCGSSLERLVVDPT